MKNKKRSSNKKKGLVWITLGLLLIAAALALVSFNLYDGSRAEQSARQFVDRLEEYLPSNGSAEPGEERVPLITDETTVIPDHVLYPNMEMPVETIDGIEFIGVLRIPALELELPIISQWSSPNLKKAPCRFSGSAYMNNLIICGHNYTSHFGNLNNLSEGDVATFMDMEGNVFTYKMVERETLLPTAIKEMESGDWDLTLFTCTLGGQSRVTIRFELEDDH